MRAGESCTCETSGERGGAVCQARVVNLHGAGLMLVGCTCRPVRKVYANSCTEQRAKGHGARTALAGYLAGDMHEKIHCVQGGLCRFWESSRFSCLRVM